MSYAALTIALFILFAGYAICEGFDDAWEADNDKHIDHGDRLAWRMFWDALLLVAYCFAAERFAAWWISIPATTAMWAWWTMIFRLTMNLSRKRPKRDWRYVSPSNWYDWQFIRHTIAALPLPHSFREEVNSNHRFDYNNSPNYRSEIHRAGTIAYIFEACVLAASVVGLIYAIK